MSVNTNDLFDQPDAYSLIELLGDSDYNLNEESETPVLFHHSPYYDDEGFINQMTNKTNSFNVLSLNSQSINAKFHELKINLELYARSNVTISAICLQETWLTEDFDTSQLQIENYNLISKPRHCSTHGGVAIYLHKSFNYNILPILVSDLWDGLFLEIVSDTNLSCLQEKKLVLGNIYRPPRNNVESLETFVNETSNLFEHLHRHKNVLIAGDFNIDLLKLKENNSVNNYFEHLLSFSYIPKISVPTRLTQKHGTLIDNFLIKISECFSQTTAGVLLKNISDHLPYFICLDYLNYRSENTKYIKVMSNSAPEFKNYLINANILDNLDRNIFADPNANYNNLNDILKFGMDNFFPIKTLRFDKYKHRKCPWMTKGMLISIKYRDKMYTKLKSLSTGHPMYIPQKINLQTYNRILKKSIRTAKRNYYFERFDKFKNDMKRTWVTIKEILNKPKAGNELPKYFLIMVKISLIQD
jgi:hypothetical protein